MSDFNVDSVSGGSAPDDLLSLLSAPVSKDYINCVWSNEPTQSNQPDGSPAKPSEPTSTQSSEVVTGNSQDSNQVPPLEKKVKKATKSPRKRNTLKHKEALDAKKGKKAALKESSLNENESNLKEENNAPESKVHSPIVSKPEESSTSGPGEEKCATTHFVKTVNPRSRITTVRRLQPVDSPKVLEQKSLSTGVALEQTKKAAATGGKWFSSNKSVLISPSVAPYEPKQVDSRFFSGNYFCCRACGDKFIFQTSLYGHMSRRTARFLYKCSSCKAYVTFFNRCTFLLHVMSHVIARVDINPGDLEVMPLSPEEYDLDYLFKNTSCNYSKCPECDQFVSSLKLHLETRDTFGAKGANQRVTPLVDMTTFRCEICRLILPTSCALSAHRRYHRGEQPHLCPECGKLFSRPSTLLSHMKEDCFHDLKRSILTVSRLCSLCPAIDLHKDALTQHAMSKHMRQAFICNICGEFGNTLDSINTHRNLTHNLPEITADYNDYALCLRFECDTCPGVFIEKDCVADHAIKHSAESKFFKTVFQCPVCEILLESKNQASHHKLVCLNNPSQLPEPSASSIGSQFQQPFSEAMETSSTSDNECSLEIYENNNQSDFNPTLDSRLNGHDFVEKKDFESNVDKEVDKIPIEPVDSENRGYKQHAMCKLCKKIVSVGVEKAVIKKHFLSEHFDIFMNAVHRKSNGKFPMHIVLKDSSENLTRPVKKSGIKLKARKKNSANGFPSRTLKTMAAKYYKKKENKVDMSPLKIGTVLPKAKEIKNGIYKCYKCSFMSQEADIFKNHIATHKLNPSDQQCPECGLCFIVRPPLEKHLIVDHCIKNVNTYLINHGFEEHVSDVEEETEKEKAVDIETLEENQCKVCREKFDSSLLLERHFRIHGGAFLLSKLKAKRSSQ